MVVPLLFKLLGQRVTLIAYFQALLAGVCWSALAWSVFRASRLPPRLRWLGALAILALSLTPMVAMWEGIVLSESVALSLLALLIATGVMALERPTSRRIVLFGCVLSVWAFTRDTNAYEALFFSLALLVAIPFLRNKRPVLTLASVGLLAFVVSSWSQNGGKRWITPSLNVLGQRILPSASATAYFVARGMPHSPALAERAGKWASDDNRAFYRDPRLEDFRTWWFREGKTQYMRFLLTHPTYFLTAPIPDRERIVSPNVSWYAPTRYPALISPRTSRGDLLSTTSWLVAALLIGIFLLATARTALATRALHVSALLCLLLFPPLALLVWHGDAMEVERHSLLGAVQLRIGVCLGAIAVLGVVAGFAKRRKESAPAAPEAEAR